MRVICDSWGGLLISQPTHCRCCRLYCRWGHRWKLRCCCTQTLLSNVRSPSHYHSLHSPLPNVIVTHLIRRHLRVALVDSSWPTSSSLSRETSGQVDELSALPSSSSPPASVRDRRVYAISPASRQLLQAVGAWQLLPADRIHNYDSMQVLSSSNAVRAWV